MTEKRKNITEDNSVAQMREPEPLDDDTIRALLEYVEALRAIATRLESEGYTFVDGKLRRKDDIQS